MKKILIILSLFLCACSMPKEEVSILGTWCLLRHGEIHSFLQTNRTLTITSSQLQLSIGTDTVTSSYSEKKDGIHVKTTAISDNLDFPKILGEKTTFEWVHALVEDEEFLAIRDIEDHTTLYSSDALSTRNRAKGLFYVFHRDGTRKQPLLSPCTKSFYGYLWHVTDSTLYIQETTKTKVDEYTFTVKPKYVAAARYENTIHYEADKDSYVPILVSVAVDSNGDIVNITPQAYIGNGIYARPAHPLPVIQVDYALSEAHKAVKLLEPGITTIAFTPTQRVTDFSILSLEVQRIDTEGKPVYKKTVLYTQEEFLPGHSLTSDFSFTGEGVEINAISFKDVAGRKHTMILNISGKDKSPILVEID